MAIQPNEIVYRLSGGASNADPLLSLGGVKSSVAMSPSTVFDKVTGTAAAAGEVDCRCIYVHNAHATLTMENAVAWLSVNTPSASTSAEIGLGTSAINAVEQSIGGESAAPSGVSFSAAASKGAGIALGSIPPGQHRAIWLRRSITAGAPATPVGTPDTFTIAVECDSAA